ncbi:MAG TPA: phosphotransferase [Candidatus Saccharimonadales bacterium]|nr:phosphotransferase [Candidatus Saccharimonadales bacterium]
MTTEHGPGNRLEYTGDLTPVFSRALAAYDLGTFGGYAVAPVGYEDFNAIVDTQTGPYFIKIFSSAREPGEISRYEAIMKNVLAAGVNHPRMYQYGDGLVYHDDATKLSMVAMEYIQGQTFYELNRSPQDEELQRVLSQAVLIHKVPHHPPFLFDNWAIPNVGKTYMQVKKFLDSEYRSVVERIIEELQEMDTTALPHCLVHGDLTKSNVLRGSDGDIFVLDFSVANWYPRIQELAVITGALLNHHDRSESFGELLEKVIRGYVAAGGQLTVDEARALPAFARAQYAAEFMGATREKHIRGIETPETEQWLRLGQRGLRLAYA